MSARHRPADCTQVFDRDTAVTDLHTPTPAQARIAAILGWGPRRFTTAEWRAVVALEAEQQRQEGSAA